MSVSSRLSLVVEVVLVDLNLESVEEDSLGGSHFHVKVGLLIVEKILEFFVSEFKFYYLSYISGNFFFIDEFQ